MAPSPARQGQDARPAANQAVRDPGGLHPVGEGRSVAIFFATIGGSSNNMCKMHINKEGKCDDMVKDLAQSHADGFQTTFDSREVFFSGG